MINQPDPRMTDDVQARNMTGNPDLAADSTVRSASTDGSYGESRHTNYVDPTGNQVESKVEEYQDKNLERENKSSWAANIIYFLLSVVEVILGLRFVFRLLGANQNNSFTLFLYSLSHVFVAPFNGIFHDQTLGTSSVFELSTLIAMLVVALIGWGLVALCRLVFAPTYGGRQRVTTTRRSQR
jgi:hypothetical protein